MQKNAQEKTNLDSMMDNFDGPSSYGGAGMEAGAMGGYGKQQKGSSYGKQMADNSQQGYGKQQQQPMSGGYGQQQQSMSSGYGQQQEQQPMSGGYEKQQAKYEEPQVSLV